MTFYYKTDTPCDGVEIIIDQNTAGSPASDMYAETIDSATGSPLQITVDEYVTGADNIQVFKNAIGSPIPWPLQVLGVDYFETSSTTVTVNDTDEYRIVRKQGKLVEGVHYNRINSRVIEFVSDPSSYNITKIYTVNPGKSKLNPAKIIDELSEVVVADVPVWDPARGHHYHYAIHPMKLQRGDPLDPDNADPALYNMSINVVTSDQPWAKEQVGTTWFDKSTLGYIPYYDDKVFPVLDDRLFFWGALAPWASVNFYQWTESDVLPEEYDAKAATQEGDFSIDETVRVTGQAKATPYGRTRDTYTFTTSIETQGTSTVSLDGSVYGTTSENDLTGLGNNFSQSFVASGGAEQFTLTEGFYVTGGGNLRVTVNGVVTAATEDSSTQFTVTAVATDTVLATITAPVYSTQITVDGGTPQTVVASGSIIQQFGQLITAINEDITGATAVLDGNEIVITSDTLGGTSVVLIDDTIAAADLRLFANLINTGSPIGIAPTITQVLGTDSEVTSLGHPFVNGDTVIVSTTGALPAPLTNTTYTVRSVYALSPDLDTFQLEDSDGTIVVFTDTGTGIQSIVNATWTTTWIEESDIHELFDATLDGLIGISGPITLTNFTIGDTVDVYVNESFLESLVVGAGSPSLQDITLTSYVIQAQDTIRVIKPAHIVTDADEAFDPDVEDDGTVNIQYKNFYDYTLITTRSDSGAEILTYYFWVGNKSVHTLPNSALSLREAQAQLVTIPTPYIAFKNLKVQSVTTDTLIKLPLRYNQMILRGHTGLINANERYVLRFTRDLTLRDRFENKESQPRLKNVHEEWEVIREKQQFNIPRSLWDKITESLAGYTLVDPTVRVPARERELYDETYNTDTQYGLDEGQIFVDGDIALTTILADLTSPDNDFYPIDVAVFFQDFSFDTPDNSVIAMDYIYENFGFDAVNRIFFSVLLDAFAVKAKYPEIFKTSMVSVHGIKLLETAGLFDD